jgi:hypothetical protein
MKKAEELKLKMVVFLTVLIMMVFPASAILAADQDGDGFDDTLEAAGIMLLDNITFYPPCTPNTTDRSKCVDPATKDLFIILLKGDNCPMNPTCGLGPSLIPTNPFELVSNPKTSGGLGVATHVVTPSQSYPYNDRTVTTSSTQKAVRVTEYLDPSSSDVLGVTTGQGMSMDESKVYTVRIKNFIGSVCGDPDFFINNNPNCKDSTGLTGQALLDKYTKHVIAHEIGHSLWLTGKSVKNYGGYHYNTTDNVEMSQSVYYTKDSGVVIFYIGTGFKSADQSGFKLQ